MLMLLLRMIMCPERNIRLVYAVCYFCLTLSFILCCCSQAFVLSFYIYLTMFRRYFLYDHCFILLGINCHTIFFASCRRRVLHWMDNFGSKKTNAFPEEKNDHQDRDKHSPHLLCVKGYSHDSVIKHLFVRGTDVADLILPPPLTRYASLPLNGDSIRGMRSFLCARH